MTEEINRALQKEYRTIQTKKETSNPLLWGIESLWDFRDMVNHGARWDIKLENQWVNTISPDFPGQGVEVMYCGYVMTVEDLGNYAYGCLGEAYGFSLPLLCSGSLYAAEFPEIGSEKWKHEVGQDWHVIAFGYYNGRDLMNN